MADLFPTADDGPAPESSRVMVGRWNIDQYIDVLRWPLIVIGGIILVMSLIQLPLGAIVLVELVGVSWIAWIITKHHGHRTESLATGAMVGLAMGLAYSVGRFIILPSAIALISFVWQTLVTGVAASLLTTAITIIFSLRSTRTSTHL